ncbi:sodium/bile acid cotransporter isoform X2 [Protopterus annectens]|uniref:sodium/bile acid cotransporter isoform X2 n=1 Tax=Protopterus annectens TaxID=7888 RepID=UPI001CFA259E|nr:sodium/bile acid cotransporter isoform X2 [Protopterus annectens]
MNSTHEIVHSWDPQKNGNITAFNSTWLMPLPSTHFLDKVVSGITIVILFITMVSLGCTMEIAKIKDHILNPKGVAIAVMAQYGVMPLTAFALARTFNLSPMESLTVLICGCCPGGNLSNIFALALKGDMNLSIVMTTCSTLLALGMMPLLLYLYSQGLPSVENAVPYGGIVSSIAMTLIPCGTGIFLNNKFPQYSPIVIKAGMTVLLIAAVTVSVLSGITIGNKIWNLFSLSLLGSAALMPFIGYILGYVLSTAFQLNERCKRTVSMETGCQNIQLCAAILKVAFTSDIIGPLYLFPFMYILFQAGEALILIIAFHCYETLKKYNAATESACHVESHSSTWSSYAMSVESEDVLC